MDPQGWTPSASSVLGQQHTPMRSTETRTGGVGLVDPFDRFNIGESSIRGVASASTTPSTSYNHLPADEHDDNATGLRLDLPKSSSRNSIFSATSPVMRPAPRLPSVVDRPSSRSVRESSSPVSSNNALRKGLIFASLAKDSETATVATNPSPLESDTGGSRRAVEDIRITSAQRPGYGRLNTEERERERERIRQSNAQMGFRLCPTRDFLLGEGRHSNVYLGSYRYNDAERKDTPRLSQDHQFRGDLETNDWALCAMKRPHSDHQSQLFALEEAFALRRLGPHPNVVRLISIRDEADVQSTIENSPLPSHRASQSLISHTRSTSDTFAEGKDVQKSRLQPLPGSSADQRRLVSQPPSVDQTAGNASHQVTTTRDAADALQHNSGNDSQVHAARLVMLLELLPFSLSTFVRRNADLIDVQQWHSWALELASVVEWMHDRGCIHADLKPENILLTSDLHVKLCDFNSAVFPGSTPLLDGIGLGTPAYGAPELSRGVQQRGGEVKGFHFPVDVWSLGAILYSLASGQEPFRRARSMIDMLYRKRVFFESEENDRIANMSVAEGSSTVGVASRTGSHGFESQPASRSGSLKGRKRAGTNCSASPIAVHPFNVSHHRGPSSESGSSVASSVILTGSANRPIASKIDYLLAESTPVGLLFPHESDLSSSYMSARLSHNPGLGTHESSSPLKSGPSARLSHAHASVNGHHRASSLGKVQASQLRSPSSLAPDTGASQIPEPGTVPLANIALPDRHHLRPPQRQQTLRPDTIRRTTSYTGQLQPDLAVEQPRPNVGGIGGVEHNAHQNDPEQERGTLHLAVAAAFANSKGGSVERELDRRPSDVSSHSSFYLNEDEDRRHSDQTEDLRPYIDGAPAIILSGGGRLPDEARNLLERMLNVNPDLRPTAKEVRMALQAMTVHIV